MKKNIIRFLYTVWVHILFQYHKQMAISAWKTTGKRHWVVMIGGRMRVVDNAYLHRFNRLAKKEGIRGWDLIRLSNDGLFATPPGTYMNRKYPKTK